MTKKELKTRLLLIRQGGLITPLLEELWEIIEKREEINNIPTGVSKWRTMGEKYGYWQYFEREVREEIKKEILKWECREGTIIIPRDKSKKVLKLLSKP
jgi:hypothetical protein